MNSFKKSDRLRSGTSTLCLKSIAVLIRGLCKTHCHWRTECGNPPIKALIREIACLCRNLSANGANQFQASCRQAFPKAFGTDGSRGFRGFVKLSIILFGLSGFSMVQAQNPVDILEADSIVGGMVNGNQIRKILGNVYLKSRRQNLEMYCDSAYQFVGSSEIRAFGNIQINTENEKIWTDSLVYFTDVDFSQLRGRVVIEADSTTLFGNSVDYRFTTKVAHFIDQIRLEDQEGILSANSGFYYREADSAVFRGRVQVRDSLQYLEGDSLFSNRENKYYEIYGEIFGKDQENDSMLKGNYLEADSTGRRLLEGDAWLKSFKKDSSTSASQARQDTLKNRQDSLQIRTDSLASRPDSLALRPDSLTLKTDSPATPPDTSGSAPADTTHIRAKRILSTKNKTAEDTTNIIHAYENVRIWSKKFSAVSDTSRYSERTETFELWSNSKTWHKEVQLTGPYIKVILDDGDIDRLESYPKPFTVQQDTSIDRLNQIKGDTLNAYFQDGNLSEIHVFGNSQLLRFTENEADKPDGAVLLNAPSIRIFFEGGELIELKADGPYNGSYLPESEQTAQRQLDGFIWTPDLRPQRPEQEMKRRFPPIPEERPFELPRRYREYIKRIYR